MRQLYKIRVHNSTGNFVIHMGFYNEHEAKYWCDINTLVSCAYEGLSAYSYIGILNAS